MFELYDRVKIRSSMVVGTIVDISDIDGKTVYIVESDTEDTAGGYGGKWKLFDCTDGDIEKCVPSSSELP